MRNVCEQLKFITILAIFAIVSGCNPLVKKDAVDTNFMPGVSTLGQMIASSSRVQISATTLAANGVASAVITVTLSDGIQNLSNKTVSLTSSRGTADSFSPLTTTNAFGVATFTVTSFVAGSPIFIVSDATDRVDLAQTVTVTYTTGPADHLVTIAGDGLSATVGTSLAIDPKVQVVDQYGNGVSGVVLSFLPSRGGGVASAVNVTSDGSGYASVSHKVGFGDFTNQIDVRKSGATPLPDLALSGKSSVTITNTATSSGTGLFGGMEYYHNDATSHIGHMATGDFNLDGKQDIIIPGYANSTIGVFLGNGNGTFGSRTDFTTMANPTSISTGDFNADSIIDLAVTDYGSDKVSVLIGNGNGTFMAKTDYAVQSQPREIVIDDFNGDGAKDLAVTNYNSNSVSILLGNKTAGVANGTFAAAVNFATGANPAGIESYDFNVDGFADLIIANYGAATISYLSGVGDGTFNAKVDIVAGTNPISVTVADLNGDTKRDVVVVNNTSNTASVYIGNGNGTFVAKVDYAVDSGPMSVATADMNGDGFRDLLVTINGTSGINVLLGTGTGTFGAKVMYRGGYHALLLGLADFDGDTKTDVAYIDTTLATLGLFLGVGDGTLKVKDQNSYANTGALPLGVTTGDFNADGALDIAVVGTANNNLSIYIGNKTAGIANGTFAAKSDYFGSAGQQLLATGDFNEDGALDIVATGSDGFRFFSANKTAGVANGTFAGGVYFLAGAGTSCQGLAVADYNNDGHLDLVTGNIGNNTSSLFLGNGNGTFAAPTSLAIPNAGSYAIVAAGDFNKDGKQDFAVTTSTAAQLSVFVGNGNGTFQARVDLATGGGASHVNTGDFDNDGKLDLVVTNGIGTINFYKGDGAGGFNAKVDSATTVSGMFSIVSDFNSDGKLDIISTNYGYNRSILALGNGNGTFQSPISISIGGGNNPKGIAAGDFNADGKTDYVITNYLSYSMTVILAR